MLFFYIFILLLMIVVKDLHNNGCVLQSLLCDSVVVADGGTLVQHIANIRNSFGIYYNNIVFVEV